MSDGTEKLSDGLPGLADPFPGMALAAELGPVPSTPKEATVALDDWSLIVATCHPRGTCARLLTPAALRGAWGNADGYGKLSIADLERKGLLLDWSHVRDSSDEGIRQVAKSIRVSLMEADLRAALPRPREAIITTVVETVGPVDHGEEVTR